jgi:pantetheine-phosphate adenylyltransferase
MRTGIYPGSFDPITLGHLEIIQRASKLVDFLYICIAHNESKNPLFTINRRLDWVEKSLNAAELSCPYKVMSFDDLLIDLVQRLEASVIIRGLRNAADYDFEAQLSYANKQISPDVETILLSAQDYPFISSTIVKSIYTHGGNITDFVPPSVRP